MTRLQRALSRLDADLRALGSRWCLVGGLAVSARAEPRTTRDVDVMVVVEDDDEAEQVVAALLGRGYGAFGQLEHTDSDRLVGMRLVSPSEPHDGLVVDLLFSSSGIEREVVDAAEELEILPDWPVPVARTGHLLALKLLAYEPEHPERRPMLEAVNGRRLVTVHERLDEPIPATAECVVLALDGSERRRPLRLFARQPVLEAAPLIVVRDGSVPDWVEGELRV